MVREKKAGDKRYLSLFGRNDFMAEEFHYRWTGWSKSRFCKLLIGHDDLYHFLYVLTCKVQSCPLPTARGQLSGAAQ